MHKAQTNSVLSQAVIVRNMATSLCDDALERAGSTASVGRARTAVVRRLQLAKGVSVNNYLRRSTQ